ncbi:PAC2 family protein [Nesterenkonia xinjiangensis]|uniref:PAC2 family protein n=1 Tax=Nesterenkonia xinjiangensis TaxID=225327 RepID=A0A7Z0GP44_9MICC|nr:PAC2 family protein [Nesterenkonia xinjiangensis]NYJ79575.1 hypothetical protein [Nesterenkonia xinjiangensis]
MKEPLDLLHVHPTEPEEEHGGFPRPGKSDSTVQAQGGDLVLRDPRAARPAENLTMLVSWAGHTDAGALSSQLSEALLGGLPHKLLASFDLDELFDYRSRRPRVTFLEDRFTDYDGPELDLYEVRDASGRPFLLLTGDEPDFQWERVSEAVLELVERLDISLVVLVDALGLPAPHTRPLGVTAHGSRKDLITGISTWSPAAQIEAGLGQVLEMRLDEEGHDVVGYTLHVPHYLAGGRYPQVAVSALEYIGAAMELMLPTDELRESARMVDQDITRQVSGNSEIQGLVHRLEQTFDEHATTEQRSLLVNEDDAVPDAEELGAAVEAFLRAQPTPEDTMPEDTTPEGMGGDSSEDDDTSSGEGLPRLF